MAHTTAAGNRSGAWRELEKKVAELFRKAGFRNARRIELTEHEKRTVTRPDVDVPEIKDLAVDTKYQHGGWHHHTVFLREVDTYRGVKRMGEETDYRWSIMPTRSGGSKDIFVTLRIEHFLEILAKAFLRNKGGGWGCPRCPNELTETGKVMGLTQYTCKACALVILSQEIEGESVQVPDKQPKAPREVIKDHSKDDAFKPLPGQLTVADLVAKKKAKVEAQAKKGRKPSQGESKK